MDLFFHRFWLTPKHALNRLAAPTKRSGIFLRSGNSFWEYFPHPELGDPSVEEFLQDLPRQNLMVSKKAMATLKQPLPARPEPRTFQNHHLWLSPTETPYPVIKYKLKGFEDRGFLELKCDRLRLDANALFNPQQWQMFEANLPLNIRARIDYIEDPLENKDWSSVDLPAARDFVDGSPAKFFIYKPYREFFPEAKRVIFSGNMGHALSQYLSYLELLERGDLTLVHGLINPPLYEEVPRLFKGDHSKGFTLDQDITTSFLNSLEDLPWEKLCSL